MELSETIHCRDCHHFKVDKESIGTNFEHGSCGRVWRDDDHRKLRTPDSTICSEFLDKTRTDLCLPGRKHHQFRSRKTHGKLSIQFHADYPCKWCNKLFGDVMRDKRNVKPKN